MGLLKLNETFESWTTIGWGVCLGICAIGILELRELKGIDD